MYITATYQLHADGDDPEVFHHATVHLPALGLHPAKHIHTLKDACHPKVLAKALTEVLGRREREAVHEVVRGDNDV